MQSAAQEQDDLEAPPRLGLGLNNGATATGNANGPRNNIWSPPEPTGIRDARRRPGGYSPVPHALASMLDA